MPHDHMGQTQLETHRPIGSPFTSCGGRVGGKGDGVKRVRPPHPDVHPIVSELFAIMDDQGVSVEQMATKSGWDQSTICTWRRIDRHPTLRAISDCLQALGYELIVEKSRENVSRETSRAA